MDFLFSRLLFLKVRSFFSFGLLLLLLLGCWKNGPREGAGLSGRPREKIENRKEKTKGGKRKEWWKEVEKEEREKSIYSLQEKKKKKTRANNTYQIIFSLFLFLFFIYFSWPARCAVSQSELNVKKSCAPLLSLLVGWVYLLFCRPEKWWERKEKRNDERIGGGVGYVNETLVSSSLSLSPLLRLTPKQLPSQAKKTRDTRRASLCRVEHTTDGRPCKESLCLPACLFFPVRAIRRDWVLLGGSVKNDELLRLLWLVFSSLRQCRPPLKHLTVGKDLRVFWRSHLFTNSRVVNSVPCPTQLPGSLWLSCFF